MESDSLLFTIFLIFFGAAVMATLALFARQALLVAYVALGLLLGPVLDVFSDDYVIQQVADIGILFLLFLLGLNLPLDKLLRLVRETLRVSLASSFAFLVLGGGVAALFGLNRLESVVVGLSLMFSSTIIGLKLLPTTVLHHKRTGEIIISILLLQDLFAILLMQAMEAAGTRGSAWEIALPVIALPALMTLAFLGERWLLVPLMRRFDRIQEYLFLLAIGWCLGIAELAGALRLLPEMGAFIAGVALARNPVSLFIAEHLKPLRDFFLIMFFFSIGAGFDPASLASIWLPAALLASLVLGLKPVIYRWLLVPDEDRARAWEVGVRLGQASEFSLLVAVMGERMDLIGSTAADLIALTTVLTFLVSPYFIVLRYPTPVAVSDRLRRD